MTLQDQFDIVKENIPAGVTLVAVSKTKPSSLIQESYAIGQRHFGENRVQELVDKAESLPNDIKWHQIGHLQTNKVKYIAPFVHLIHAVDSEKLLREIDKQAAKAQRKINCLLQIKIADEESKFGWDAKTLAADLADEILGKYSNISIHGLMGMATFTEDQNQVRNEFKALRKAFETTQSHHQSDEHPWSTLSMGMSGDYQLAIEEGSTMVRVGSALFGSRG